MAQYDLAHEVDVLRDLRRRSGAQSTSLLDPDLPPQLSPTGSPPQYWTAGEMSIDPDSSSGSHEGSEEEVSQGLYWVPASLHPEIAPAEFRAFLKEHARGPHAEGTSTPERSNSSASEAMSSALGRKKSMLSRQYRPVEGDGVEQETVVPMRRNRNSIRSNTGPQLTISDLQKLEELADEASVSHDPSKLRSMLRRSLSLNISPSELMDDMGDLGDEADAPIIVPPPGQILRRAARTKIRKPGLPGDGGGHRFGASRRGPNGARLPPTEPVPDLLQRTSSDVSSSSDHGDVPPDPPTSRPRTDSMGSLDAPHTRPDSFSEEASIYDAYARGDEDDDYEEQQQQQSVVLPPVLVSSPTMSPAYVPLPLSPMLPMMPSTAEPSPVLHQPQPQRLITPSLSAPPPAPVGGRTPSPEMSSPLLSVDPSTLPIRSPSRESSAPSHLTTSPTPSQHRKDKDKKGLFGKKWGDKGGKKGPKDKERENREHVEKEKEKDSGFFGSLFGSKKKQDDAPPPSPSGSTGRETAAALLGASKSNKSSGAPSPSPSQFNGVGINGGYARYPIHVERAIYRLSHIKLANPRRPLYEQVLISNLMFWYLGVINKAQTAPTPPTAEQEEKERELKEQREREERERLELEAQEREREERERQRQAELQQKKESSPRRAGLTKAPSAGAPSTRRAEMPVRGPQYEMQHREMQQQEYSAAAGSSRSPPPGQGGSRQPNNNYHYTPNDAGPPQLPPGAMAPLGADWLSSPPPQSSSSPRKHAKSPSPPPTPRSPPSHHNNSHDPRRASRSPPPPQPKHDRSHSYEKQGKSPGRSQSAIAVSSTPSAAANVKLRKMTSAHAVVAVPNGTGRSKRGDEEEDLPLAMWQQQQRR